jgi:4-hydroxybenzoate polyprenyltransferase
LRHTAPGETTSVFAVAIALVLIGLVLGFLVPPFGFVVAAVGLVLFVLYLFGVGRTATRA